MTDDSDDDTVIDATLQADNEVIDRPKRKICKPVWTKDYVMHAAFNDTIIISEPQSFNEAITCLNKNEWKEAMKTEYNSLISNNV